MPLPPKNGVQFEHLSIRAQAAAECTCNSNTGTLLACTSIDCILISRQWRFALTLSVMESEVSRPADADALVVNFEFHLNGIRYVTRSPERESKKKKEREREREREREMARERERERESLREKRDLSLIMKTTCVLRERDLSEREVVLAQTCQRERSSSCATECAVYTSKRERRRTEREVVLL